MLMIFKILLIRYSSTIEKDPPERQNNHPRNVESQNSSKVIISTWFILLIIKN